MIVINEKIKLIDQQIFETNKIIEEKQALIMQLLEQRRQPPEWREPTAYRIKITNDVAVELMLTNKPLIDYLFNSDITVEKLNDTSYVYVNFINQDHLSILIDSGAVIEENS